MCCQWYKRSSCCLSQVEGRVIEDVLGSAPEISGRGVELRSRGTISSQDSRAIRRRTWSRDEVNLLNLKNLTDLPCWLTSWLYLLVEAPIYLVTYLPQKGTVFIFYYNRKRYLDMCLLMHLISYSDSITKVPLSAYSVFTGCAGQFAVGIGLPALSKNQTGHGKDSQQNQVHCSCTPQNVLSCECNMLICYHQLLKKRLWNNLKIYFHDL